MPFTAHYAYETAEPRLILAVYDSRAGLLGEYKIDSLPAGVALTAVGGVANAPDALEPGWYRVSATQVSADAPAPTGTALREERQRTIAGLVVDAMLRMPANLTPHFNQSGDELDTLAAAQDDFGRVARSFYAKTYWASRTNANVDSDDNYNALEEAAKVDPITFVGYLSDEPRRRAWWAALAGTSFHTPNASGAATEKTGLTITAGRQNWAWEAALNNR